MDQDADEKLEKNQFEELIQGLIDDRYGCCNDFVTSGTITGLMANMQSLIDSGIMKPGGFDHNQSIQEDKQIRGDKIHWLENQSTNEFEAVYLKKVRKFINHLNETCFTSIKSFESHYSCYEKNSFYKRHLDQFQQKKERKYSVVLYLNQDWYEADGGMLSMYPVGGKQMDLSPLGGRMVFFRSDEMEHEVRPSYTRERRSIAGWFKN